MRVSIHTSVGTLASAWGELAEATNAPPWMRPEWIEAWCRAFGRGRLEILATHRDRELVGVLPLAGRVGWRAGPTNWHTPAFDLVVVDSAARQALAEALFRRPRVHGVTLRPLPADQESMRTLEQAARAAGHRVLSHVQMRSPFINLRGTYEDYLGGELPGSKVLRELRRRRRRLESKGELSFTVYDGSEDLDARLEMGLGVEARGWQGSEGTAMASRWDTRMFYTEIAKWAAARGWLRLLYIHLDDRPVAFKYCVEFDGALYDLKGGYDAAFRKWGPGMILMQEAIAWCYAHGLKTFEMLGTDEPYKLQWADGVRERSVFRAFAPSPGGTAAWAAWSFARPAVKRALTRATEFSRRNA